MTSVALENVAFGYQRDVKVFSNLSLRLATPDGASDDRGRVVAIMGASGCGKTTLLRLLAGIEKPADGVIGYRPEDAVLSYVPQEPVLFDHLSRVENAQFFRRLASLREFYSQDLFDATVKQLDLSHALKSSESVIKMSGGERQRLALLRALSIRPRVLLFDEPCTGLDVPVKQEFLLMLRQLADERQLLVVYVTHHAEEVRLISDEIVFISRPNPTQAASICHQCLCDFLDRPPNLEAARFFASPALNVLPCRYDGTLMIDGDPMVSLGQLAEPGPPAGDYLLAFTPDTVRWQETGGIGSSCLYRSSRYMTAQLAGPVSHRVVGPCVEYDCSGFSVRGSALLFSRDCEFVQRVTLRETDEEKTSVSSRLV